MSSQDQSKGIVLGDRTRWVISGLSEFEPFFRHCELLLPQSPAIIYFEGVSIAPEVRAFFESRAVPAWHAVRAGTWWPKPSIYHLPATRDVLEMLADLALRHAYPEIADHCHVYTTEEMILQWYDACDPQMPLGAASIIPEQSVKAFCERTRTRYEAYIQR